MSETYLRPTGNEITHEVKSKNIITLESNKGIDLSLLRKRGNSKTFSGWLISEIKTASKNGNLDMVKSLEFIYNKYKQFETSERLILKSWKGKSSLEIINKPDCFIVVTYQKESKDSKPSEVRREIPKLEVNRIIKTISELDKGTKIPTRDIGELAYKRKWDDIFSDRFLHTNLNLILRLLDYYKITKYRSRYSTVLNKVREIQEVL
jgi:hypothetical protein